MAFVSPSLNYKTRCEARATLDMPGAQARELEVLALLRATERAARDVAFNYPGPVGDRMDELAERLAELGRE